MLQGTYIQLEARKKSFFMNNSWKKSGKCKIILLFSVGKLHKQKKLISFFSFSFIVKANLLATPRSDEEQERKDTYTSFSLVQHNFYSSCKIIIINFCFPFSYTLSPLYWLEMSWVGFNHNEGKSKHIKSNLMDMNESVRSVYQCW